ncbi:RHS repeat-associated core domain-containing protein [Sorangium sp. So ce302]|uniref:RHS repeat-associated core domain-containing protein n=1 Tax=Sorangium sp. So ce302 TaxID=3133297 RepID=UPI003F5E7D24
MARTAPVPNIPAIPGMNPGVWIMGGGGGGGGKGGRGGSGNGDGQGGSANHGGNNPDGGGKGANGCGNGQGAGACSNPVHGGSGGTSAGDPVDVVTGRVFTLPTLDLGLPGPLPLVVQRRYSSSARDRDMGLGFGWSHSLSWEIELSRRAVRITQDDGTVVTAPLLEEGETRPLVGQIVLRRAAWGFALTTEDGLTLLFNERHQLGSRYRLTALLDRNGNCIELGYDVSGLAWIRDCVQRFVRVRRERSGRIAAFEVRTTTSPSGWHAFFTYRYDERGDLVEATDAEGHVCRYAYDEEHRLVTHAYRSGLVVHYRYDREGRCIETWGEYPAQEDPSLADGVPVFLADGVTRARGIFHCKLEFSGDGYSEVADSLRVRRFFGNKHGKVDRSTWGAGVLSHEYDSLGNIVAFRDAMGATTRFERDAAGRVTAVVDPLGRRTQYAFDDRGALTELVRADGSALRYTRDDLGNLLAVEDRRGAIVMYDYDERGLVSVATLPNGGVTRFEHDAHGNRTAVIEPNGAKKTIYYDDLGRVVATIDALGAVTRYAYDARGLLRTVSDPAGGVTTFEFDAEGRLARIVDAARRVGRLTWGGLNVLCEVQHDGAGPIRYRYNREGHLIEVHNERGQVHRFVRSLAGHVIREELMDGRTHDFRRDLFGRLTQWRSSTGELVEYEYDAAGQLIKRIYDGGVEEFAYDEVGRLTDARTPDTECYLTYDERGCLVKEEQITLGVRHTIEAVYDSMGRRTRRVSSLGYVEHMHRDIMGKIARMALGREVVDFHYDALGRERQAVLPGGGRIQYDFDPAGRLAQRRVFSATARAAVGPGEPEWVGPIAHGVVSDTQYRYSPAGLLEEELDARLGATGYRYDPMGQLLAKIPAHGRAELFGFDEVGNLYATEAGEHAYDRGGALLQRGETAYAYDERARLVEKRLSDGNRWKYTWDGRGRLASVVAPDGRLVEFIYDAFCRRLAKRVRSIQGQLLALTRFVWDDQRLLHEVRVRDASLDVPVTETRTYVFPDGSFAPLAHIDDGGAPRFYVSAPNGFPDLLVTSSGQIAAEQRARAFGAVQGEAFTPLRFPGQYADEETGLCYNRHRYYDPDIGRYISPDPVEIVRRYGFADNSPLNTVDLDGLQPMTTTIRRSQINPDGSRTPLPNASGVSMGLRDPDNPVDIHPTVWNNMAPQVPIQSDNGNTNWQFPQATRPPANCSEPAALSEHLYDYERRNNLPRGTCGSGSDPNNQHLRNALREITEISSIQQGGGPRNACPNCGVLIGNLQSQAQQGAPPDEVVDLVGVTKPDIDKPNQRWQGAMNQGAPTRSARSIMNPRNAASLRVQMPR